MPDHSSNPYAPPQSGAPRLGPTAVRFRCWLRCGGIYGLATYLVGLLVGPMPFSSEGLDLWELTLLPTVPFVVLAGSPAQQFGLGTGCAFYLIFLGVLGSIAWMTLERSRRVSYTLAGLIGVLHGLLIAVTLNAPHWCTL